MKNTYKILLTLDLHAAAKSLGLQPPNVSSLITEENLYSIINEIEIALLEGDKDREISSVCGLLWTHFEKKFDLLGEFIYSTMVKIGFPPVKTMLEAQNEQKKISYSSLFSMIETAAEMQRESLNVFDKKYFLTRFQKSLWGSIEAKSHIAVSAPTSAGKSFLICLNVIQGMVKRGGISIYIVPTLTLMGQVANDLINLAREHGKKVHVRTHFEKDMDANVATIYVVTQERLADLRMLVDAFDKLNYLIIDEVQNIERAFDADSGDTRAKLLFDVLIDLHDNYAPYKTIILGPRIAEVKELGEKLFNKPCTSVTADASPVTNICYSITPGSEKNKVTLTQFCELNKRHLSLTLENSIAATGFGKSTYDENYLSYLSETLLRNKGSLIFSPTASQARNTAVRLSGDLESSDDPSLISLSEYIKNTVAPQYDLVTCIRKGVAFHHGKIPHHVRNAIELAVVQGKIPYVACTTTLMQGVNIPAKNVFLRNPNLFLKKRGASAPKLSGYEVANLRGRAGRLLKDFVGRTFILDGTSFQEDEDQQSLFEPASKSLDGSYSEVFKKGRGEIIESLLEPTVDRGTLAKYINNILYTDPSGAAALLRKGIRLSEVELKDIKRAQQVLTISPEICRAHRFWDPYDLQLLKEKMGRSRIPASPFSPSAVNDLAEVLTKVFKILPAQAEHYVRTKDVDHHVPMMLSINAVEWATEKPLREILGTKFAMTSNANTERVISTLQNTVSYGIPALLSPVYAMFAPQSLLLSAIERGAYQAGSVVQINNNVPRETAIAVTKRAKKNGVNLSTMPEVLHYLKKTKVSYWSAIQFRHLINIEEIMN